MTWTTFYLVCFGVGFTLTLISFLGGFAHWHLPFSLHLHLPHGGGSHAAGPAMHFPAHAGGHGPGHMTAQPGSAIKSGLRSHADISPLNFMTLTVFLAWFGGTGYLLTRYTHFWVLIGLGLSTLSGLAGAGTVFFFLVKVLIPHERVLDPADYELVGVVATVSSPIREGGTGEIIFSQQGVRRASGARSQEGGEAIPKDTEVVIVRYEKGIAHVKRWEEWTR